MSRPAFALLGLVLALAAAPTLADDQQAADEKAKIVLIAGRPSHGPGDHEFNAGCKLLAKCFNESCPGVEAVVVTGGWPEDESVFEDAKTVVFFMDGGGGHPMIREGRMATMRQLMSQDVGLVCLHYAVEFPKGEVGDQILDWLGGYYETGYSTNPHWTADIRSLPDHPITRGVEPFSIRDEWYFNIRFRPGMDHITPIVVATPDDATREGTTSSPRGPYEHIVAAKGREEVLAWAFDRPGGGRSFGFTGAHFHKNWGDPNFRKLVMNAILWTANQEVPAQGVECRVTAEDLAKNLDPK